MVDGPSIGIKAVTREENAFHAYDILCPAFCTSYRILENVEALITVPYIIKIVLEIPKGLFCEAKPLPNDTWRGAGQKLSDRVRENSNGRVKEGGNNEPGDEDKADLVRCAVTSKPVSDGVLNGHE